VEENYWKGDSPALAGVTRIIGAYDAINAKKANQRLLVPVEPSLVRSGCWLIAPEMASRSAGHANTLFRVTRMRPESIMFEEPNASASSRPQDFGKVTLVSRDASLGSFGLDMMAVTQICVMIPILSPLTTPGVGTSTD